MKGRRGTIIRITAGIVIVLLAVYYFYFIAGGYNKDIANLRMQSKLMQFDIATIDDMKGDESQLDADIAKAKSSLIGLKNSASVSGDGSANLLNECARRVGATITSTSFDDENTNIQVPVPVESIDPDGTATAVSAQRVTIILAGDYSQGAKFMNFLESAGAATLAVESFAYTGAGGQDEFAPGELMQDGTVWSEEEQSEDNTGTWIFTLVLYYYEAIGS
jgi:hypothetical protein